VQRHAIGTAVTGAGQVGAERRVIGRRGPIEAVACALTAVELRRIDVRAIPGRSFRIILLLCVDDGVQEINGLEFIFADAAVKNLLLAERSLKEPRTIGLDQGDGQRPVFRADIHGGFTVRFFYKTMHLVVFLGELPAFGLAVF
jgi:hypothetical protein